MKKFNDMQVINYEQDRNKRQAWALVMLIATLLLIFIN